MKYFLKLILIPSLLFCVSLIYTPNSIAGVDLPWSTTFNCDEWTSYNQALNCDGLSKGLNNQTPSCGKYEEIISDANMVSGGGGKGQRHWVEDGYGVVSGGTQVNFNMPQSEFWIRWYMRFQEGWDWDRNWNNGYDFKILYIDASTTHFIIPFIPRSSFSQGACSMIQTYASGNIWASFPPYSACWDNLMSAGDLVNGHRVGDGLWHCYELHVKAESSLPANDGEIHMWIDGELVTSDTSVNTNTLTFNNIKIGSNVKYPRNGTCVALDYDDIAISNTGYIGPISGFDSGADNGPPSPPEDLKQK